VHTVIQLLQHTSPLLIYLIVALALALESTGIPIVNSTLLLCTGALATYNHLNVVVLASVATAASIAGACCAYMIGARGGRRTMLRFAYFFHLDRHKVRIFERWFRKYGIWMVFASRIIPYIRPFTCFPAGFSHTNFARFLVSASVGSLIWCTGMLYIGWSLGHRWVAALYLLQRYTIPTLILLVLVVVLYSLSVRFLKKRIALRLQRLLTNG
jgi:membrane protein DedA with SNARE-associated domain